MDKTRENKKIKRYKRKKLRFPVIDEENKRTFSDQFDVGPEMPNSSHGVYHLRRTEPKEIHLLYERVCDQNSNHSEIEGAVGALMLIPNNTLTRGLKGRKLHTYIVVLKVVDKEVEFSKLIKIR